jgi:predicted lipoprotein with Yx(FWY)xxD motif
MKNVLIAGATIVAACLLAGSAAAAPKTTVTTTHTGLGRIVADAHGRSLYLFEKDTRGHSACTGVCTNYWPPLLTTGKPVAIKGAKPSLLGSIRRADGGRQVTYAGHPLYFFSGDSASGQTTGEGLQDFGAGWYVLTPTGKQG